MTIPYSITNGRAVEVERCFPCEGRGSPRLAPPPGDAPDKCGHCHGTGWHDGVEPVFEVHKHRDSEVYDYTYQWCPYPSSEAASWDWDTDYPGPQQAIDAAVEALATDPAAS